MLNLKAINYPSKSNCPKCSEPAYRIEVEDDRETFSPTICPACGWGGGNFIAYSQAEKETIFFEAGAIAAELIAEEDLPSGSIS